MRRVVQPVVRSVASNRPLLAVIGAGVAIRVIVILAYTPSLPVRGSDSYEYLRRSIEMSAEGSFHPFLYPALIRPLIAVGGLGAIAVVHHLAGLGMGALLFLLLRRLGSPVPPAALAAVPVLFDARQLAIEHRVLSEPLFQLAVVSGLVLLAWRGRPSVPTALGAGLLVGTSVAIRFAGLGVVPAVLAYVAGRRHGWAPVGALVAGLCVPVLLYGAWFRSESGTLGISDRQGLYLRGRVMPFADCAEVRVPRDLRFLCPEEPFVPQDAFKAGLPEAVWRDPRNNGPALEFARRMILANPGSYAATVLADFGRHFLPTTTEDERKWWFPPHILPADQRRIPEGIDVTFRARPAFVAVLTRYQLVVRLWGPLLGALLTAGAAGGIIGLLRRGARSLGLEALAFTLAAVGMLLFAAATTAFHFRFVMPAVPLAGPAAALGVLAALGRTRSEASGRESGARAEATTAA